MVQGYLLWFEGALSNKKDMIFFFFFFQINVAIKALQSNWLPLHMCCVFKHLDAFRGENYLRLFQIINHIFALLVAELMLLLK